MTLWRYGIMALMRPRLWGATAVPEIFKALGGWVETSPREVRRQLKTFIEESASSSRSTP